MPLMENKANNSKVLAITALLFRVLVHRALKPANIRNKNRYQDRNAKTLLETHLNNLRITIHLSGSRSVTQADSQKSIYLMRWKGRDTSKYNTYSKNLIQTILAP